MTNTAPDFSSFHLSICTPCYGGQLTEPYASSLLAAQLLFQEVKLKYSIRFVSNESLVTRARNVLVASFLENSKATHLMFIDADIRFDPKSILKMLQADEDIIAGAYPKKSIDWENIKMHAYTSK